MTLTSDLVFRIIMSEAEAAFDRSLDILQKMLNLMSYN